MSTTPPVSGQHASATTIPPAPDLPANSLAPPTAHALATPPPTQTPTASAAAPPTSAAAPPINVRQLLSSIPEHWRPFGAMLIVGGLVLHYWVPVEVSREVNRREEEARKVQEEQRRHAIQDKDHQILQGMSSKLDDLSKAVAGIRTENQTIISSLDAMKEEFEALRGLKAEIDHLKASRTADKSAVRRLQAQYDKRFGTLEGNVYTLRHTVSGVDAKVADALSTVNNSGASRKPEPDLPSPFAAQPPDDDELRGKPKRQASDYMKKADPSKPLNSQQDPGTRGAHMGSH